MSRNWCRSCYECWRGATDLPLQPQQRLTRTERMWATTTLRLLYAHEIVIDFDVWPQEAFLVSKRTPKSKESFYFFFWNSDGQKIRQVLKILLLLFLRICQCNLDTFLECQNNCLRRLGRNRIPTCCQRWNWRIESWRYIRHFLYSCRYIWYLERNCHRVWSRLKLAVKARTLVPLVSHLCA